MNDEQAPISIPPHPRIRQRRVEVKREDGRRRLRAFVLVFATVAVGAGAYGAMRSPFLDVDHVRVRGATHTTGAEVVERAGLTGKPMVDVRPGQVALDVERLPWVEEATVERRFPNTVEITLVERTPVAAMAAGPGNWAVIDLTGRVLAHGLPDPGELTRLETAASAGAPGTTVGAPARAAIRLVDGMPDVLAGRVPAVAITDAGALELRLDGKVPVAFGPPTQLEAKVVALASLVQKADLRRVRTIDVRVPSAPVLTRG